MNLLKGKRTYIIALLIAFAPELASALAGVDWQTLGLSPRAAGVIGTIVVFMRAVTTGPAYSIIKGWWSIPTDDRGGPT